MKCNQSGFFPLFMAAVCLLLGLSSCEKNEVIPYQGNIGVYFAVQHGNEYLSESFWPYQPSSTVSFVKYDTSEIVYPLKVMITGPVEDFDRHFNVSVNPDSTTAKPGVHYREITPEVLLPAGSTTAYVEVHLLRAPDLEKTEKTLGLKLVPNKDFGLSFPHWDALPELTEGEVVEHFDASMHTIHVNDFLVEPAVWYGSIQDGNRESGLWGAFGRKKLELMTEVMGVTYADFATDQTMPLVRAMLITNEMQAYLIKRYNAGNPVLEDDGRLMWIGSVPWSSYLGVPWVPGS